MKEFDFERAWRDVAKPEFTELMQVAAFQNVLLFAETPDARACQRGPYPMVDWPSDGGELRAAIEALSDEELSRAAHAVYFYGHWGLSKHVKSMHEDGFYWKLSAWCDEVLCKRHNMDPRNKGNANLYVSKVVRNGVLEVRFESRDYFGRREIGPAIGPVIIQLTASTWWRRLRKPKRNREFGFGSANREEGAAFDYFEGTKDDQKALAELEEMQVNTRREVPAWWSKWENIVARFQIER